METKEAWSDGAEVARRKGLRIEKGTGKERGGIRNWEMWEGRGRETERWWGGAMIS